MKNIAFLIFLILTLSILSLYIFGIPLAFKSLGFDAWTAIVIFWIALFGSYINIPIKTFGKIRRGYKKIKWFDIEYKIPYIRGHRTTIAINVGGALIPIAVSIYEIIRLVLMNNIYYIISVIVGISIIAIFSKMMSKSIKGMGIVLPGLVPPFLAALIALLLPGIPAITAYLSGTLGTLIGADILNLNKIKKMRVRVASIGGAGTFDGIFLSGIIAVLLVS